jgi:carbamoyl-phosphate synthase large subunit
MGAGMKLPSKGRAFISIKDADKGQLMLEAAQILVEQGFTLVATRGTQSWLEAQGVPCELVNKVYEGRPHVVDMLKDGAVQLLMNTTEGAQAVEDSKEMRSVALYDKIPYFTTAAGANAAARAIKAQAEGDVEVKSLQG